MSYSFRRLVPPEVEASYATIIDSILAASDLNTISEKRIRKGLQQAVEYDITPQKTAIKTLIMSRFDKFIAEKSAASVTNGHTVPVKTETTKIKGNSSSPPPKKEPKRNSDDDDLSDVPNYPPPKKKRKVEAPIDDDAAFAARLQAEENIRARNTRGGANRRTGPIKKKKIQKKKSSTKIKAEDDSDVDGSGSEKERKVNRTGGFHKPLNLSPPLSALLDGEIQLSRPQTVKRIWAYVKERGLQDPNDKRQIRCDEAMRAVFKSDKVHMFTMNKILGQNLYSPDD
ncbi:hypothetical protein MMC09_005261 [Bachmanniomyces sp. S44760]|nr:hypothetical protein [Bachmanniomyces sp. S44760]